MIERQVWVLFEKLVGKVLEQRGYDVELRTSRPFGPRLRFGEIDVLARNDNGEVLPVEVKLSMRDQVSLSQLRDAGSVAGSLKDVAVKTRPLLVYGALIEASRREWAEQEFQIEIWDREVLLERAGRVRDELDILFRRLDDQRAKYESARTATYERAPLAAPTEAAAEPEVEPQGKALIAALVALPAGKKDAKTYETICRDIIAYLFSDDLRDPRSQKRTSDGLNVYDLVYRVSPKHPFWVTLTRDFRARVVLFECKNYGKPIGAMQVFTTERYLSAGALRPVCFVLSRKSAHPHAVQAASGAMRESGKLLVFLSDADLIKMLRAKDAQVREGGSPQEMEANDPTEILDQTIYDFIAGLPR